ncbi:hypothetical protein ACFP1Z_30320 [Streptomyces gamaensis]|uniref:DUF7848 domain-containing protein n=1 Tax=Streptomyces gamaensis TaxID=1763542 RepID=A0ABW0ZAE9_9ACTN
MTRSVVRFARWRIHRAKVPALPWVSHDLECIVCFDRSGPCNEFETARTWAFTHSGRHPSHTAYREVVHRYWRAVLVD